MKTVKYFEDTDGKGLEFLCPGCMEVHRIYYEGTDVPLWKVDFKDPDNPTIRPSIRVSREEDTPEGVMHTCCHSYVTKGKIRFLPDCTHELVGKIVQLPDLETFEEDQQQEGELPSLITEIVQSLGIENTKNIKGVSIRAFVQEPVIVQIERYVDSDDLKGLLLDVFETYRLKAEKVEELQQELT